MSDFPAADLLAVALALVVMLIAVALEVIDGPPPGDDGNGWH